LLFKFDYLGYDARTPITLGKNAWTSSEIIAEITSILLDEVLGVRNDLVMTTTDEEAWKQLANGHIHALMEFWCVLLLGSPELPF
jgi:ABC-type proline/glycine betaine transport system substrate-binding protein